MSSISTAAQSPWYIAFTAALMNALQSGSFFFTPTTLMPEIVKDFNLPLSLSTVPIAIGKVAYVLLLIPGGMLVDHYGPRRCVLVGIFGLAFLMTCYASFVSSFWMLLSMHILLAPVASVSGVPIYSIFIAQWFEGGIGLAMGLVLAGYSAAGTCIPPLLGPIASIYGWRVAMGCMCALLWFVGLPVIYFFLHEKPQLDIQDEEEQTLQKEEHFVSRGMSDTGLAQTKSWTFVGFAFSYILLQYCFGCFGENIMFFLTLDRDMSLAVASLFFGGLNFSAFTAKLVGGHLGDRFDRFHVASTSSGLAAAGIAFLFLGTDGLDDHFIPRLATSPIFVLVFTILFGFGYGATFNCLYALTPIVFGKKNLGRTQSTLFGLGLAGNAVGSVMTGVMRSHYGSYQRPFLVAAIACSANFLVFNVTRLTLGGSLKGLKELSDAERIGRAGSYHGLEELEAAENAARQRIGDLSDSATSPRRSPISSFPILQKRTAQYGAVFVSGSNATGGQSGQVPFAGVLNDEGGTPGTLSGVSIPRSGSKHSGTGMQIEDGYPVVRDWSASSLRANLTQSPGLSRSGSKTLQRSSTLEKMIESGILSASLEAVGYMGNSQPMSRAWSGSQTGSPRPGLNLEGRVSLDTVPEIDINETATDAGEASEVKARIV